jgi:hypothetical protein
MLTKLQRILTQADSILLVEVVDNIPLLEEEEHNIGLPGLKDKVTTSY